MKARGFIAAAAATTALLLGSCALPGTATLNIRNYSERTIIEVYLEVVGTGELVPELQPKSSADYIVPGANKPFYRIAPGVYNIHVDFEANPPERELVGSARELSAGYWHRVVVRD